MFPILISCGVGLALWINTFYIVQNEIVSLFLKILVAGVTYLLILSIKFEYRNKFVNYVKRIAFVFQKFNNKKANNE